MSTMTLDRPPRKARGAVPAQIPEEIKAEVVRLLTEQPEMADQQIAAAVGVSRVYVLKIRRSLKGPRQETTEEYGRQLAKKLPLSVRVSKWHELVTGKVTPLESHALRSALTRVDELIGHVTVKERKEKEDNAPTLPPMFVLPAGSTVQIAAQVSVPDKNTTKSLPVVDAELSKVSES